MDEKIPRCKIRFADDSNVGKDLYHREVSKMNCNTKNAKIAAITEKTLVVGIDVGSETHYARAFDHRGIEFSKKAFAFSNDEAGFLTFKAWAEDLAQKAGKNVIFPGMEPTGHYWFNLGKFLQDNGMRPVHVNPHHVKKTKELDDNSPSKNDRKDPRVIAGLVNEGRYTYPYIPEGIYAEVRNYAYLKTQSVEQLIRIKNRLARWFSIYFPNYKDVYKNPGATSGIMILKVAPLPEDIVKLGEKAIEKIWRDAKVRAVGKKRAQTLVEAAMHSIGSKEAPGAARKELTYLLADYEAQKSRLEELEAVLTEKVMEIPYIDKLMEIKGIGLTTAAGFIAEVGDISRFDSPKQLQKLAGLAIVNNESGKHQGEHHISYRGRKRLRYVLYEAAVSVVSHNEDFKEIHHYYTTRQGNALKKMQSLIAVSCKLIRIFYTLLTKGVTYDAERMRGDIRRPQAA